MEFEFNDQELTECQEEFNRMDPEERLYMTHYDLAKESGIRDSAMWKKFLMETRVSNWIDQEITLIKSTTLRRLIKNADSNDRSVGAAQMLNALNKSFDMDTEKEGPTFVYSYVPLNAREQGAPNTQRLDADLFERRE